LRETHRYTAHKPRSSPARRAPFDGVALIIDHRLRPVVAVDQGEGGVSTTSTDLARRWFEEAWSGGDLDVLDAIVAPGYRSHIDEINEISMSRWTGPKVPKVEMAMYRSGMPDCRIEVTSAVAGDDEVATFFEFTGTNSAPTVLELFEGTRREAIEATQAEIEARGAARFSIEDGMIAAARIDWRMLGPLDQIRLFAAGSLRVQISRADAMLTLADDP
jgi:hypothetical protein